jgi:hypothetical protein
MSVEAAGRVCARASGHRSLGGARVVPRVVWCRDGSGVGRFCFLALTLSSNFQTSLLCQLREPLLGTSGAEQRNGLRSEPLFGDRHELLERAIAGLAKELDRSRRLPEAYTTRQVVNDAAPACSRAARG